MFRRLIGMGLLIAAFLTLPTLEVCAQKKPDRKGVQPGDVIDSANLPPGEFIGKIRATPDSDRRFSLEVEVPQAAAAQKNPNTQRLAQLQVQMQQAQAQLAAARTPQQQQQAMRHLQNLQRQLAQAATNAGRGAGNVKMVKKEIEFQTAENVKVRTLVIPDQFDEKGTIKKHTREELAKLKGKDSNLPGYQSALEKVAAGQKVRVVLAAAGKAAAKDKDKEEKPAVEKKKQVKTIIILEEASGDVPAPKKEKKKK